MRIADSSPYAHYVFKAFDVNCNGAISFRVIKSLSHVICSLFVNFKLTDMSVGVYLRSRITAHDVCL